MKAALRLLRRLLPPGEEVFIEGACEDLYERAVSERGRPAADRWLWGQILRSIPGFLSHKLGWAAAMFRAHLLVSRRQILRHKALFLVKVFGLAAGVGCAAVIILYVTNELTYDAFHPGSERIFRVVSRSTNALGQFSSATAAGPLRAAVLRDAPQVEAAARVVPPYENAGHVLVARGETRFFERRVWFVDPDIVDVFGLPAVEGDPRSALAEPRSVVLTESAARKYFGQTPAVGQTLRVELDYDRGASAVEDFQVRAVVKDAPDNTHWKYDVLISMPTLTARRPPESSSS